MRLCFTIIVFACAATVLTACDRAGNPAEAAQVGTFSGSSSRFDGARDPIGGTHAEVTYDVAIIRIATDHEIATDHCDTLMGNARIGCMDSADRQRDASSTQARTQRDLSRR